MGVSATVQIGNAAPPITECLVFLTRISGLLINSKFLIMENKAG